MQNKFANLLGQLTIESSSFVSNNDNFRRPRDKEYKHSNNHSQDQELEDKLLYFISLENQNNRHCI